MDCCDGNPFFYNRTHHNFSLGYKIHILNSNFAVFYYRSYGYAEKKHLHYSSKAEFFGSKQKVKMSSYFLLMEYLYLSTKSFY